MSTQKKAWQAVSAGEVSEVAKNLQSLYNTSLEASKQSQAPFPDSPDLHAQRQAGMEIGRQLGLAEAIDALMLILLRKFTVQEIDSPNERRPGRDCPEIWWLAHLAIGYAEDMCFRLCETKEWAMVHQSLGLPAEIENAEIKNQVAKELAALGWKWSPFGPEWQPSAEC